MDWQGGRKSGNIEDRRGLSPAVGGGIGLGGLVIVAIGYFVFGISPDTLMGAVQSQPGAPASQEQGVRGTPQDEAAQFVDVITTSTDDVWKQVSRQEGWTYTPPAPTVIYTQGTSTACGAGQSAMGPFYCPGDKTVYLDLTFWQELESQFRAGGEFARAYVIAHEVGHHVQNLRGDMRQVARLGRQGAESGQVRLELQADCYAGVWAAHATQVSNIKFTAQDVQDALTAAAAVGDDTIQKRTQGQVVPDAFTHGTAEQRMRWFKAGYDAGGTSACDTFSARRL